MIKLKMTSIVVDIKFHIISNISHILCMDSNVVTELFTDRTTYNHMSNSIVTQHPYFTSSLFLPIDQKYT